MRTRILGRYKFTDERHITVQIHLCNLPTENIQAERYVAKYVYLAFQSVASSNKHFKAQRIRDDFMFTNNKEDKIDRRHCTILKH